MIIGSMNHPGNDLIKEIKWISDNFDFLDLTLELPKAHPDKINVEVVKALIEKKELPVIGHTAWYLPIGSPFSELRMYALKELDKCAAVFEELGVRKMNVHMDNSMAILKEENIIKFNIWSLRRLISIGRHHNIDIMVENTPGIFSQPRVMEAVFRKVPKLLLHLDIGHANIGGNAQLMLKKFSKRLVHIHISDNHGRSDEHLALGKGSINWSAMLGAVKKAGYDDTITLEVFTSPKERLNDKPKLRKLWDKL